MSLEPSIVLASESPRRIELLKQVVENFLVHPANLNEEELTTEDPYQTARHLAQAKALHVQQHYPESLVIGADTVMSLLLEGTQNLLGKPVDSEDAANMLRMLSGHSHTVTTGVCVVYRNYVLTESDSAEVHFRTLSEQDIQDYIASGEPMGKAGAYAIQGYGKNLLAGAPPSNIDTVIGLPVSLTLSLIEQVRTAALED